MRESIESIYQDMIHSERAENKVFGQIIDMTESAARKHEVRIRYDGIFFLARNLNSGAQ